ncbi:MAG: zinc ribbon domain-containing protein [Elusimicrobiaceae bacterium]|nr:zinc ribbon domain-containing protein [Elusimicrobiaceae bacterium]
MSEITNTIFQEPLFCSRCHAEIRDTDNYCHACGKSLKPGRGFLFTHTGIIIMALVLGPLALPFVWISKAISFTAKIIYTIVLCLMGIYIAYALWQAVMLINQSFQAISTF